MDASAPLSAVRVLDFTSILSGPYCTRILADCGAEVIKVEPPEGDHKRSVPPMRNGSSGPFAYANAGKRSLVLDLKSKADHGAALDIARSCNVVVENWRPGVAMRLGLDYAAIRAINPTVVYCSISGYGQRGPLALRPALAPILHATSGYENAQMQYHAAADRPPTTGIFHADVVSGLAAFGAISAALYRQKAEGIGAHIDVSMLDVMINLQVYEFQEAQFGPTPRRTFRPLKCRDGFVVVAPVSAKNFEATARAVGHPEWIADPRFSTPKARVENWGALLSLIEDWTMTQDEAVCERLFAAGDVPAARYRKLADTLRDPHLAERGTLARVMTEGGEMTVAAAPFQFDDGSVHPRRRVPSLGEDTSAILDALRRAGDPPPPSAQSGATTAKSG